MKLCHKKKRGEKNIWNIVLFPVKALGEGGWGGILLPVEVADKDQITSALLKIDIC